MSTLEIELSQATQNKIEEIINDKMATFIDKYNNNGVPLWLNKGQVAKFLGISRNTLEEWLSKGLPYNVIGGSYRFNRDKVTQWILQYNK